ncbi:MAG: carboxypeptidase regulatory-like domain-containing protein [Planctomyces sp.]|nr:carboxypeptidase regulatory-like domain-containing protein [Planctomyces sp.]
MKRMGNVPLYGVLKTLAAGVLAMSCGCSSGEFPGQIISGQVTMDGEPLANVGIRFYEPKLGRGLVANIDAVGEYSTPTPLPPGRYEVSIAPRQPSRDDAGLPPASPVPPDFVPAHYLDGATSDLQALVTDSESRFDFSLSEKTRKKNAKAPPKMPVTFAPDT